MSLHTRLVLGWTLFVGSAFALRLALFITPALPAEISGWLFLGLGPSALIRLAIGGAPPPTAAEVLYAAEQKADLAGSGGTAGRDARRI